MSDTEETTCTTHHRACDCREAEVARLLRLVMRWHSEPGPPDYKGCDICPCAWCDDARRVLGDEATKAVRAG